MKILTVPTNEVPSVWPLVVDQIGEAANYHPFMTADDMLERILRGHAVLILVLDNGLKGAAIMQVEVYGPRQVGMVLAMGGVRGFLSDYVERLREFCEDWSRAHGCDTIALTGRPGWSRFLRRWGGEQQQYLIGWGPLRHVHASNGSGPERPDRDFSGGSSRVQ